MARNTFAAQVTAWAKRNDARLTAVFRASAQTVANECRIPKGAGGNMPVLTGNLRRSLTVSTVEMPSIGDPKTRYDSDSTGNIALTIARVNLGQTIYLGFQAVYAPYQENKNGFVRLTAQRWPEIVAANCKIIHDKVER
jgi:hypothetical protein